MLLIQTNLVLHDATKNKPYEWSSVNSALITLGKQLM